MPDGGCRAKKLKIIFLLKYQMVREDVFLILGCRGKKQEGQEEKYVIFYHFVCNFLLISGKRLHTSFIHHRGTDNKEEALFLPIGRYDGQK